MSNFFSKGPDYFELFVKGIDISLKSALELQSAFRKNGTITKEEAEAIKTMEHEGDLHVHQCSNMIATAFITPIDRSDIMAIIRAIENITDSIDGISNQIYMMQIATVNQTSIQFVDLIVQACQSLKELLTSFKQFKKNTEEIHQKCIDVNNVEEEGDRLYSTAMRDLFSPESNLEVLDVIRLQNLYNTLENSLDYCEDVSDIIEQVIISNT